MATIIIVGKISSIVVLELVMIQIWLDDILSNSPYTLFFFISLFILIFSCKSDHNVSQEGAVVSDDFVPELDRDAPNNDTLLTDMNSGLPKKRLLENRSAADPIVNFFGAEPISDRASILKFYISGFDVDWAGIVPNKHRPRTLDNPHGLIPDSLQYGDFGWQYIETMHANTLTNSEGYDYYAISGQSIVPLSIDSIQSVALYYENGPSPKPSFSGHWIGYPEVQLSSISFVIQTNIEHLIDKISFYKLAQDNFEYSDFNGSFPNNKEIIFKWGDLEYRGKIIQPEIDLVNTSFIYIKGVGNFLHISMEWGGIDQICEHFFELFSMEELEMIEVASKSYGCDH